jgi:hypothetical protein
VVFFILKRWQTLRRRDGSQYASNIKRAIQASLGNNSATMPIFKVKKTQHPNFLTHPPFV